MTARSQDDIPIVDKIVHVCSAFNNVCASIVINYNCINIVAT